MQGSPLRPPLPPLIVIIIGITAVSTASIFIRYAQEHAPSLVIAAYRLTLATLFLSPLALSRHRKEISTLSRRDSFLATLSGAFLAVHFAAWISSLAYTTVASSVVLVSTSPLWVALLSPLTLKEAITRPVLIGLSLALIGGVIIGMSDACLWGENGQFSCPPFDELIRGRAFLGNMLALIGAWSGAGYLLIGRRLRVKMTLISYIFLVYGAAAVILVATMLLAGYKPWGYSPPVYLWLLLLALIPQLLGHSAFNWALRYLSAAYVSITLLGEPIGSTILAYFLLQEKPTMLMVFGAILILAGIYIATQSEVQAKEKKEGRVKIE